MANPSYMSLKGNAQGHISAGCSTPESIGNKYQSSHIDEIMVLSYHHKMANIGNLNKATHTPIIITKAIDKSSPLLAQALANREEISCTISFYRVSSFGMQEKFYSVGINGGIIVDITSRMSHVILQGGAEPEEQISIRYREITWSHHLAGTSGHTAWGEEV
ncbi:MULTISPECIES: Hcp family type VI secretion system effector [unclassified Pseudomonas]|uniref:Hcp family type VI secretion system effector n=1 Tax=unclassified Pseudomonas TaxID=196821 RepID=UPI002AC8CFB9|nr:MULTISPECIES: Hcp family type VI secretion system effector [unclassified Pseudomonas]MEB0045109.1 Hcp family type VI secretion system effector [Pseudomonas sp. Dout3]MEB0095879.1 Hcp family type VI secretion system effector [Pseudomonas sp. DC1.2]WPX57748.1 Hcp family type VI secretion system effector [Pseudomonas sp. DC1.2]